jgi:Vanadium chloroperoxidase N-terminal domain
LFEIFQIPSIEVLPCSKVDIKLPFLINYFIRKFAIMKSLTKLAVIKWLLTPGLILFTFISCRKEINHQQQEEELQSARFTNPGQGFGNISPEMILQWNEAAVYTSLELQKVPNAPPVPPFVEARYYAMVNVAMHDALNNIIPKYQTYALREARDKDADANAAVAQAAYDVIVAMYDKLNPPAFFTTPQIKNYIDNLLQQSLSTIVDDNAKTKGINLGKASAAAVLQKRANDGIANVMYPVTQGTLPGQYRFTAPFDGPPFNGFLDSPGWGDITNFGGETSVQFLPPAPYPVNSAEYTADYNEIKKLGCATCTGINGRTQEQEDIAKFWAESSPYGWNKVAREIIAQQNMDAWRVAKILSLLQMAEADAYIGATKAKMHYFYWRPVTAIQLGDNDGNPNTVGDPNWQVLLFPTPPVPDYPSAHATAGGAAAEVIKGFFNSDNFSFSFGSTTLPGHQRSFNSLSQAARENSLSRIYIGYHFRKACMEGEGLGRKIGSYVFENNLKEN